jgi:hypothetical protein
VVTLAVQDAICKLIFHRWRQANGVYFAGNPLKLWFTLWLRFSNNAALLVNVNIILIIASSFPTRCSMIVTTQSAFWVSVGML